MPYYMVETLLNVPIIFPFYTEYRIFEKYMKAQNTAD